MSERVLAIVMPKWGMTMNEGTLAGWLVEEGRAIAKGEPVVEIETTKITNVLESPVAGVLRRRVRSEGDNVAVGALLAAVAESDVPEPEVDAFVAAFRAREASAEVAAAKGPETQFVSAGGRRFCYLRLGSDGAVPVVMIHGFGGDLGSWLFNQPELAEGRPAYAFDLPGHGGSSREVGAGDVPALADAALDFLGAAGIERAHLVGHSLGGAVALALALDHPGRVATLSLVAPCGLGADIDGAWIQAFLAAQRRKEMKSALEPLFADPRLISRDMVETLLRNRRIDGVEAALRAIAGGAFANGRQATVLVSRMSALERPAQAIWGTADRIVPARHGKGLGANVRVHLIEGAGHMVHMERAGEVNRLLKALLSA